MNITNSKQVGPSRLGCGSCGTVHPCITELFVWEYFQWGWWQWCRWPGKWSDRWAMEEQEWLVCCLLCMRQYTKYNRSNAPPENRCKNSDARTDVNICMPQRLRAAKVTNFLGQSRFLQHVNIMETVYPNLQVKGVSNYEAWNKTYVERLNTWSKDFFNSGNCKLQFLVLAIV